MADRTDDAAAVAAPPPPSRTLMPEPDDLDDASDLGEATGAAGGAAMPHGAFAPGAAGDHDEDHDEDHDGAEDDEGDEIEDDGEHGADAHTDGADGAAPEDAAASVGPAPAHDPAHPLFVPRYPLSRVRKILREDPDVATVSPDAVFAVAALAERFVAHLAKTADAISGGRKTLRYADVAKAVGSDDVFDFLEDLIPPTMPYSQALKRRKTDGFDPAAYAAVTSAGAERATETASATAGGTAPQATASPAHGASTASSPAAAAVASP